MADRYITRSPRRGPLQRDRPPPRDRDDHPNVEYFGAGESYRPGGQTGEGPYRPPVRDRDRDRDRDYRDRPGSDYWTSDRRDDRRDDRRRDDIDSYIPPTSARAQRNRSRSPPPYRRRSRSPPGRGRTELFPDRARSPPPPRRFSPRHDRTRSPIRRRSRSPYAARGRSPDVKRSEYTPPRRSPRRDRIESPRGRYERPRSPPRRPISPLRVSYRPRSRTPPRRGDRRPTYADESWRRRSPSPRGTGPGSGISSRRSSPRTHPDRTSLTHSRPASPPVLPRSHPAYDDRRDDNYTGRTRSPLRSEYPPYDRSPADPPRERDEYRPSSSGPPSGPRISGQDRQPPSGPSKSYAQSASPPTGPSRTNTFAAPAYPRGRGGRFEGQTSSRDFTSPTIPSALRGRTSLTYRAPGYRPPHINDTSAHTLPPAAPPIPVSPPAPAPTPPSGPRATSYSSRPEFPSPGVGRGGYPTGPRERTAPTNPYHNATDFPFRPPLTSNNSTSTTYPRSQRFNTTTTASPGSVTTTFNVPPSNTVSPVTPATPQTFVKSQLATLERVVPGGKKYPGLSGLSTEQEKRMRQLEEDAERMRGEILEKQRTKREALREWENRERESEVAGLKSELADEHLRSLAEEDSAMVGAAF